jgi:hypothetical protein
LPEGRCRLEGRGSSDGVEYERAWLDELGETDVAVKLIDDQVVREEEGVEDETGEEGGHEEVPLPLCTALMSTEQFDIFTQMYLALTDLCVAIEADNVATELRATAASLATQAAETETLYRRMVADLVDGQRDLLQLSAEILRRLSTVKTTATLLLADLPPVPFYLLFTSVGLVGCGRTRSSVTALTVTLAIVGVAVESRFARSLHLGSLEIVEESGVRIAVRLAVLLVLFSALCCGPRRAREREREGERETGW